MRTLKLMFLECMFKAPSEKLSIESPLICPDRTNPKQRWLGQTSFRECSI